MSKHRHVTFGSAVRHTYEREEDDPDEISVSSIIADRLRFVRRVKQFEHIFNPFLQKKLQDVRRDSGARR